MAAETPDFRPLSFIGGRFDLISDEQVGFPLELLAELARYERLLIQVARGLWLADHQGRRRAPKGFDERLRMTLTGVDRGSVEPVMRHREVAGPAPLFDPDQLSARSSEMIADTFAAVVAAEPIPQEFPSIATTGLVQFGSSLHKDEICILPRRAGSPVRYTQDARRHLVAITSSDDIKIDGQLVGTIGAVDANRQSFEFIDRSGVRLDGMFKEQGLFRSLKEVTDRHNVAPYVRLDARYSTNEVGNLSSIEDVSDLETVIASDDPMSNKLRALLNLESGWLDGEGEAPDVSSLEWVRDFLADAGITESDDVVLFPTAEGGVAAERQIESARWSLEVEPDGAVFVVVVRPGVETVVDEIDDVSNALESYKRFVDA